MLTFSNYSYPYVSNNLSEVSNIIQGLPDNKNNLITPQNLRDAIYTTWINNVFKQTTASGSYYIGLDSDPASNILTNPFYFGKRTYLGNNVMNSELLNNDTDIFFFNNKSDSITQSTIVTFLAGNPSLFNKAPYIITAATNSGLDISIINPNGNVNLLSASNSNIYLNGYQFPSINATSSVGQALILSSNNLLSWQSIGNNFTYNNSNLSTIAVGGVPIGTTFSNISVTDLFNKMFYPNIAPVLDYFRIIYTGVSGTKTSGNFYQLSSVSSGTSVEIGSLTGSIIYSVSIQPKSLPVIYATFSGSGYDSPTIISRLPTSGTSSLVVTGSVLPVPNPNTASYIYSVYVKDTLLNQSNTLSTSIPSYYPYYCYRSTILYNSTQVSSWITAGGTFSKFIGDTSGTVAVSYFSSPQDEYLYLVIPINKTGDFQNLNNVLDKTSMYGFFNVYTQTITTSFWVKTYYIYISASTKKNINPNGYSFS